MKSIFEIQDGDAVDEWYRIPGYQLTLRQCVSSAGTFYMEVHDGRGFHEHLTEGLRQFDREARNRNTMLKVGLWLQREAGRIGVPTDLSSLTISDQAWKVEAFRQVLVENMVAARVAEQVAAGGVDCDATRAAARRRILAEMALGREVITTVSRIHDGRLAGYGMAPSDVVRTAERAIAKAVLGPLAAGPTFQVLQTRGQADEIAQLVEGEVVEIDCSLREPRLCKSCKHWKNWKNKAGRWVSECTRINDAMADDPKDPRYASLATDEYASLETGPEFGCVLWEAR